MPIHRELLLSRATPSAVSEHLSEFIGCPISRSVTTYCVYNLKTAKTLGLSIPSGVLAIADEVIE
jgi:hypothetical protein